MKKTRGSIIVIIILVAAITCALGLRVYNGHLFFFDLPDRSGWVTNKDGRLQYLDRHAGAVKNSLLKIGTETYYFDSNGYVFSGEIELEGFTYFFNEETGEMHTGWLNRAKSLTRSDCSAKDILSGLLAGTTMIRIFRTKR